MSDKSSTCHAFNKQTRKNPKHLHVLFWVFKQLFYNIIHLKRSKEKKFCVEIILFLLTKLQYFQRAWFYSGPQSRLRRFFSYCKLSADIPVQTVWLRGSLSFSCSQTPNLFTTREHTAILSLHNKIPAIKRCYISCRAFACLCVVNISQFLWLPEQ